jgi:hypothetical protein
LDGGNSAVQHVFPLSKRETCPLSWNVPDFPSGYQSDGMEAKRPVGHTSVPKPELSAQARMARPGRTMEKDTDNSHLRREPLSRTLMARFAPDDLAEEIAHSPRGLP